MKNKSLYELLGMKAKNSIFKSVFVTEERTFEGYKIVEGIEGDISEFLEKALGENNTDASGMAKPMLATDFSKIKKINYPVIIQPKLDGVRCLIFIDISEEKREIKTEIIKKIDCRSEKK